MRYRYSAGENGKLVKKAVIYTSGEHGINFSDVDSEAVNIIRRLKSSGHDSYIVGGAVRDLILGKKPKDFDIVSSASPAKIRKIFRNSRIIGRRFRLVHVYSGNRIYEVSTFRSIKDGITGNVFGTIDEDVHRRDFSINALFYDPEQQIVVDYVNGMKDIKKRQIKPVIPLPEIFTEDPVRMIRAVKYAAITGFSLPFGLKIKINKYSSLLSAVSPSRLTEEIFKIINSDNAAAIVSFLYKMGLYNYLQPNAASLMRKNPDFMKRYLQRMAALKGADSVRGQALGSLFSDYLETVINWKQEQSGSHDEGSVSMETIKLVFKTARSFILPINPPKFEMEYSVKKFLAFHGIIVKRLLPGKPKPAGEKTDAAVKKRRRKPRKKNPQATE